MIPVVRLFYKKDDEGYSDGDWDGYKECYYCLKCMAIIEDECICDEDYELEE